MSQYLSKDWNIVLKPETDVMKVYESLNNISKTYKSNVRLVIENDKMPINLFTKIIINEEYEIQIQKKENMIVFQYNDIKECIPCTNKNEVVIPLFNLNIEHVVKIDFITLNKMKKSVYLFCPFANNNINPNTFKSNIILLDNNEISFLADSKLSLKCSHFVNNKVKEEKYNKSNSNINLSSFEKDSFFMCSLRHEKTNYSEFHLLKSIKSEADAC